MRRRLRAAAGGGRHASRPRRRTRRALGRGRARISASTPRSATPRRPRAAFARAAHVVRLETWVQRVTGVPMEPRAAVGRLRCRRPAATRSTPAAAAWCGQKNELAVDPRRAAEQVRVIVAATSAAISAPATAFYPEFALVAWAARRIGRPVKWTCERSEAFLSDYQGRDLAVEAELALDADGNFLALRGSNTSNLGAPHRVLRAADKGVAADDERLPHARPRTSAAAPCVTNTPPTTPYRSAGRPEAMFVIERLIDLAAAQLRLRPGRAAPAQPRSRRGAPYANPLGVTYDSGDYARRMRQGARARPTGTGFAARRARGAPARQAAAASASPTMSRSPAARRASAPRSRSRRTARSSVVIGTLSSGPGPRDQLRPARHRMARRAVRAACALVTGDTDRVAGRRRLAFRPLDAARAARHRQGDRRDHRQGHAASPRHAARSGRGRHRVRRRPLHRQRHRPRARSVRGRARRRARKRLAGRSARTARRDVDETVRSAAFPTAAHVCEVEIDPETGAVEIVGYAAVDDVGRAINPLILHGQTMAASPRASARRCCEQLRLRAAAAASCCRARSWTTPCRAPTTLPSFATAISEVPSTNQSARRARRRRGRHHAGAGASMINAVVDALAEFGVTHIDMPATPERVWRAIEKSRGQAPAQT